MYVPFAAPFSLKAASGMSPFQKPSLLRYSTTVLLSVVFVLLMSGSAARLAVYSTSATSYAAEKKLSSIVNGPRTTELSTDARVSSVHVRSSGEE